MERRRDIVDEVGEDSTAVLAAWQIEASKVGRTNIDDSKVSMRLVEVPDDPWLGFEVFGALQSGCGQEDCAALLVDQARDALYTPRRDRRRIVSLLHSFLRPSFFLSESSHGI